MKRPTLAAGRLASLLALVVLAAAGGCGKKGPPLAPLLRAPAAPEARAVRLGDEVRIQVQVPTGNADGSTPADVAAIEVYGYTGETPDADAMRRDGTLVATVPVRRPPEEPEEGPAAASRPERPPGSMKDGFDQGDTVTVRETIGPAQREVVEPSRTSKEDEEPEAGPDLAYSPSAGAWLAIAPPLGPPVASPAASRVYMAVGVTRKGRRGPFTSALRVPLLPAPSPPNSLAVRYDEKTIVLTWEPPPDLRRPTLPPRSNPDLLEAKPLGMPSSAGTFNAFLAPPAAPAGTATAMANGQAAGQPVTPGPVPRPLNESPLADPRFEEPVPAEAERCYQVTAVATYPNGPVQSEPSAPACAALTDTFPPPAPRGLAAVGAAGAISLIWERSEAADLAGYLVLRADGKGEAVAVTGTPLAETTFRDEQVRPGVVYRYVVVAVDKAGNRSGPSNTVEESAR